MIEKTKINEIDEVIQIIDQAKFYFKEKGIDQWQKGYPNADVLYEDIQNNKSYVLKLHKQVVATMCLSFDEDKDYSRIEGEWFSNGLYGVIHRIAVRNDFKGKRFADILLEYAIKKALSQSIHSIRVDTHKDNLSMQSFLERNGFIKCGIIYIDGIDPRYAYEKILNKDS